MATINCYLAFKGNCEEAFTFYKSVFGGEFSYIGRYKDMPASDQPIPEALQNKIMHVGLPISQETMLLGCDYEDVILGNNISLCITPSSEEEAKRIFEKLSEGGKITMPLEKTFWNSLFGQFTDKFGILWMVDCPL